MEYQIIPISSLKRIESWLTDETGFSLSMLHNELDYISDVYLLGKQFPVEIQDLYLSIKKKSRTSHIQTGEQTKTNINSV